VKLKTKTVANWMQFTSSAAADDTFALANDMKKVELMVLARPDERGCKWWRQGRVFTLGGINALIRQYRQ
jgi:hypothetical protein